MVYQWKPAFQAMAKGVNPQVVGERLEAIKAANGELTRELVLAEAEKKKSPLHKLFTWDDTEAARKYRLAQAGEIIRQIEVVITKPAGKSMVTRGFVRVTPPDEKKQTYIDVTTAFEDPIMREQVVKRARRELLAWKARYEAYEELGELFEAIDAHLNAQKTIAA